MIQAVAAVVGAPGGDLAMADVALRDPQRGEIVVRIAASGVCPTDLFGIDGGAGDRFPSVFGHEGAGLVIATGEGVSDVLAGDHVVLGFDSCGDCAACRGGHPTSCAEFAALNYSPRRDDLALAEDGSALHGGWMAQSAWATHVVVGERAAVPIPPDVPWEVAAALGCGVLTGAGTVLNVLTPGPDDTLLVLGAGTTGLAAVMVAAHRGVERIVVSEPDPARRELALAVGATAAGAPGTERTLVGRDAANRVLDTVGTQESVDAALDVLRSGGTCATVALRTGANHVQVSQSRLLWGRQLVGVIEGDADLARDVPRLVALWRAGRLPVERLITSYPFADAARAVAAARARSVVKPMLRMRDELARPAAPATGHDLIATLRSCAVPDDELAALWGTLPAVRPAELRGLWRGWAVTRTHPVRALLEGSGWYGKLFASETDVVPIVVTDADGTMREDRALARGRASLLTVEHLGLSTAAMAYDGQPVVDAFVRLGPDALLGVMTGRGAADGGVAFHFVLEREPGRAIHRAE